MTERYTFDSLPTAAYGVVFLLAAVAYYILQSAIVSVQGPDSVLPAALGRDLKGKISPVAHPRPPTETHIAEA